MKLATVVPMGFPPWSRQGGIGDYGGALDKKDSETEGQVPYAGFVYRELQSMRGSAYTKKPGTIVHAENLAIARYMAALAFRTPEKVAANALPGTSDERLDYWVEVLGVPTRLGEQRWQLRQRCATHYEAAKGPTLANITDYVTELLGPLFVKIWIFEGADLANPPAVTHWPGVNPGPVSHDLGLGTWLSSRCHLVVEVVQAPAAELTEFLNIMNVQLFQLLDRVLPAWATFNWSTGLSTGFNLDIDQLDFTGLTP